MILDHLMAEYARHQGSLAALATELEAELSEELTRRGVKVHFVSSRVKAPESLRRKLARPDKTYRCLWDVTDLVGLRIATYFEDAIEEVARFIEARYQVDFTHSADKLRFTDSGKFGYRSLHYVCAPPKATTDPALRFEIQVRTVLQHAWAEIEHDLGYKAEAVNEQVRRRFSRIASLLEIADEEFVSIRRALDIYQKSVRAELASRDAALPLDLVSLEALSGSAEVAQLDETVATALGKPRASDPFFPQYLLKLLRLVGLATTKDVGEAVTRHGAQVALLVGPYFEFSARAFQLEASAIDAVQRGYGLFFLAHLEVLHSPELQLSKVARLTAVYQQLDHLVEARAHEVAIGLVAAWDGSTGAPA